MKFKHQTKIWVVIIILNVGVGFLFLAKGINQFCFVILACLLIGLGTSLGTIVVLGFIKCFPPMVFSYYSTGTGFSGVLGAILYLLLKIYGFSFDAVLIVMLFFYPLFGVAFYLMIRVKVKIDQSSNKHISEDINNNINDDIDNSINDEISNDINDDIDNDINSSISDASSDQLNIHKNGESNNICFNQRNMVIESENITQRMENLENNEAKINEWLSINSFFHIVKIIWPLLLSFYLVYLLEYICITELAEKIENKFTKESPTNDKIYNKTSHTFFEILQLAYECGIFISRSSLDLIKIRRTFLIVLGLFFSTCLIIFQIYFTTAWSAGYVYFIFFFVGICGGLGYSNVSYLVFESTILEKKYKVEFLFQN